MSCATRWWPCWKGAPQNVFGSAWSYFSYVHWFRAASARIDFLCRFTARVIRAAKGAMKPRKITMPMARPLLEGDRVPRRCAMRATGTRSPCVATMGDLRVRGCPRLRSSVGQRRRPVLEVLPLPGESDQVGEAGGGRPGGHGGAGG